VHARAAEHWCRLELQYSQALIDVPVPTLVCVGRAYLFHYRWLMIRSMRYWQVWCNRRKGVRTALDRLASCQRTNAKVCLAIGFARLR
jgi:hypothetical protein